ncbi:TVP38/TMEM64 family protein [Quadrisphaera oryzae]|uniref:TVP38/TMEM64 family protein n=1 Tax=Quadrisphaera TaxID=317661 RepID=UPI0016441C97|nr:TVP38/TMEM64 family protein [Quadrisphaera sp. RL12-1S]
MAAAAVIASRLPLPGSSPGAGPGSNSALVSGPWAPLLFGAVYAAATLAPLPKSLMSAAAGAVFGLPLGAAVVWAAAVVGAGMAFWLARLLGRDAATRLTRGHLARVDDLVQRHGLFAVLGLRLVPVVPFTAVNYASGFTAVRFGSYLLATAVGILPGTLAFVALGAYGTDPTSLPFLTATAVLVVLTLVAAVAARRRHRRPKDLSATRPSSPTARQAKSTNGRDGT